MGELKQVIIGTLLVVGIGGIVIGGILNLEKAFIYIVGTVPIGYPAADRTGSQRLVSGGFNSPSILARQTFEGLTFFLTSLSA